MNKEQLLEILNKYEDIDDVLRYSPEEIKEVTIKTLENFGGEGRGSTYYTVFSVDDGTETRIFKRDAFYESNWGVEWEPLSSIYEVEAVEKVITVYQAKKND